MRIPAEIRENVTAGFISLIDAAEDMSPAFKAIAGHLEYAIKRRFETNVAPDGSPWTPSQRAIEDGGKTLVKSGDLERSIISDFGADFAAAGPEMNFGPGIYAAIHQFGGRITPKEGKRALNTPFGPRSAVVIPARPYVGLSEEDRSEIQRHVSEHLENAIKAKAGIP